MTDEKILGIAVRHGCCFLCGDCWEFEKDSLLDFARAFIEEERERIKQIVNEVGRQGNHDKWFDCADAIVERIMEVEE